MNKLKSLFISYKNEGLFNIRFLIIWFMVAVYPLIVIPNPFYISFPVGVVPPNYFYAPRYVILVIISIIALLILIKDKTKISHPVFIPLFLFVILIIISSFLAPVPITAWIGSPHRYTGASTYFCCIILFILASTCSKDKLLIILSSLIFTAAVVSIIALLQYAGINLVPHDFVKKDLISYGTMPHPNFLGTYMVFTLPGSILLYLQKPNRSLYLVSSLIIFAGLVVSLCRGAWLAFLPILLIIVYYVWKNREKRKKIVLLFLVFLTIICILIPFGKGIISSKFSSISGEVSSGISMEGQAGTYRVFIWQHTIKLLKHFWAFGIGPDCLIYAKLITPIKELVDKAHNIYLEIAVTLGVFALFSYLSFLFLLLRKTYNENGFLIFTMITAYLVQGFVNIDIVAIMPLFWIVLGLSLANSYHETDKKTAISDKNLPV